MGKGHLGVAFFMGSAFIFSRIGDFRRNSGSAIALVLIGRVTFSNSCQAKIKYKGG